MAGLIIIGFFVLYFFFAKKIAGSIANRVGIKGLSKSKIKGLVLVFMWGIIFWDVIPVYVLHSYKCSTESGLQVFKTPENWAKENQKIIPTLKPSDSRGILSGNTFVYPINNRIISVRTTEQVWHLLHRRINLIADSKTGEILAKEVNFFTKIKGFLHQDDESFQLREFKLWLIITTCPIDVGEKKWLFEGQSISDLKKKIEGSSHEY